jgi:F0F1-type ATP synthase assembly protein I
MAQPDKSAKGGQAPQETPGSRVARQFAAAIELPFVLVADVLIGGGIGYWLDERFHTSPLFLLLLGGLGLVAGMMQILRALSRRGAKNGS